MLIIKLAESKEIQLLSDFFFRVGWYIRVQVDEVVNLISGDVIFDIIVHKQICISGLSVSLLGIEVSFQKTES